MSAHFLTDIRTGQQSTVQQGLDAVMLYHRCSRHLAEKTRTEHALDRATGMVGAQGKIKTGLRMVALQRFHQTRHTFARTAKGVNVDF